MSGEWKSSERLAQEFVAERITRYLERTDPPSTPAPDGIRTLPVSESYISPARAQSDFAALQGVLGDRVRLLKGENNER
jgi:hypothetical protein